MLQGLDSLQIDVPDVPSDTDLVVEVARAGYVSRWWNIPAAQLPDIPDYEDGSARGDLTSYTL